MQRLTARRARLVCRAALVDQDDQAAFHAAEWHDTVVPAYVPETMHTVTVVLHEPGFIRSSPQTWGRWTTEVRRGASVVVRVFWRA